MENADLSRVYGRSSLKCVDPAACCLTADKSYAIIGNVVVKASDSVRASAYARKNRIGESALFFEYLSSRLTGNNSLKIADDRGERVWAHYRAETIMRIVNTFCPLSHSLGNRIFKSCRARFYGNNSRAEEFHSIHIESLTLGVLLAHKYNALHAHESCSSSCSNSVLTCACLGDKTCLAHFLCEQSLTENVVYLVRTCVVEILTLEIYLSSAESFCELLGIVKS